MIIHFFRRTFLILFLFLLYILRGNVVIPNQPNPWRHDPTTEDARCAAYPDPGNIAVAVKTSAAYASLEQLNRIANIFHCLSPDRLLFLSDLDQTVGPYTLHNVLSQASPTLLNWHHDFSFYRKQERYAKRGLNVRDMNSKTPVLSPETSEAKEQELKILDKYKFLHMVEKAWELQPDMDWYVFADPSAYYFWPNLVRWLREIDPAQARFFGKASRIASSELDIANEQSGFVMSGAAVKLLVSKGTRVTKSWDKKVAQMENGQHVLATALHSEISLKLTDAWPLLIGETLGRIPFKQEIWCEPVVGLADVPSNLVLRLLNLEQSMLVDSKDAIFTYKHLFNELSTKMSVTTPYTFPDSPTSYLYRRMWDNIADSTQYEGENIDWKDPKMLADPNHFIHSLEDPNKTPSSCAKACDAFVQCTQFSYLEYEAKVIQSGRVLRSGGVCYLSTIFRFGVGRGINVWDDDGGDGRNPAGSVANTQLFFSAWNRQKWVDYSNGLRCH
ncbi:glycosyltransferase family 31 protein [Myriangium duriaei CBS 260.36]|uniref:Glycosyltransferase family 31 protein n=1 Tax=Myriangium duriaei CBS 260.36 TaxID=1168546 RepID=A0A9P4JA77_9PEZI|nr:glycosyltransferase family 31 protein [Myriangium duriaei CBS 260.36]